MVLQFSKKDLEDKSKEELIEIILEDQNNIIDNEKTIVDMNKIIKKLRKELEKYNNSNTPPSANKHLMPNTFGKKNKGGKRGAPKGHKGITRIYDPVDVEDIDESNCPKCNSSNIFDYEIITKTYEEIPDPVVPEVKKVHIHKKKCRDCGKEFLPKELKNKSIPIKGNFGPNIIALVVFTKFVLRGVLRKSCSFLNALFAFTITPATLNKILERLAEAAESEFEKLILLIHSAKIVYIDETSFSVNGKKHWLWVFRTNNEIMLMIREKRDSSVLKEVLGENFAGFIICDCWRAYDFLENAQIQRCWAHLLRKSEIAAKKSCYAEEFHESLEQIFHEIKEFNNGNPTRAERSAKFDLLSQNLFELLDYYVLCSIEYDDEPLRKLCKYISNHVTQWFTCVKFPNIEPTNNFAEQAIRESVLVRKIIGAFRSESGPRTYERLASLISTWELKGLDLKTTLSDFIAKNMCYT